MWRSKLLPSTFITYVFTLSTLLLKDIPLSMEQMYLSYKYMQKLEHKQASVYLNGQSGVGGEGTFVFQLLF